MKHFFLLPAFLLISHTIVFSQGCLPEGITFTAQEQIDNFQTDYPGCTEIEGEVRIKGDDINNLNGLNVITSIGGYLYIEHNDALVSLSGLENLTSIQESLQIFMNNALVSLTGLENLTEINGNLLISMNSELVSLTAMENITSVEGNLGIAANNALVSLTGLENITSIEGKLIIGSNNSLESLIGLENLVSIGGSIQLTSNDALTTLTGLENVTSIGGEISILHTKLVSLTGLENIDAGSIGNLFIIYNSLLSSCDVQSICNYLVSPNGLIYIHDNATGCNSQSEVEETCNNSIDVNVAKEEITLFPNPATSLITINVNGGLPIEEAIIYNHLGQKALVAVPVNNTVDVSGLKPGIFFLEVITSESRAGTKLLVE